MGRGVFRGEAEPFHHLLERDSGFAVILSLALFEQQHVLGILQQFLDGDELLVREDDKLILAVFLRYSG